MNGFTPLRAHSNGSLLHGVASPETLITRALALGHGALALTDRDNLYLAVRFYRTARHEGLRPLLGAVVTDPRGGPDVLALPADRRGFAHLCALLTARHLDERFDLVRALADRDGHAPSAGLHLVVESPTLADALLAVGVPAARGARDGPRAGSPGVWLGVRGLASERPAIESRAAAARRLGVPVVATGDVVLLDRADHDAHRAAVTAAHGELLERMPESAFAARDAVLEAPDACERRVRVACAAVALPWLADEALGNNRALAERCRVELDLGEPIFPRAPLPEGVAGPAHLLRQCEAGLVRRYPDAARRGAARARLAAELEVIDRMGFTDYFLLVAEIVGFARERGIPTVGRGSGASSLVAYALGITNVDPLRYGLTFERFLNPTRRDCPDLDIDLCWRRRDDVIRHVYDAYGHDRVAMICTHATLGARSAFRETAKALGVPNARVNALARRIPRDLPAPYAARLAELPGARHVDWSEPPLAQALALAERLDGAPRHLSVHSGGVVIADRPLTWYVPLERAAKDVVVTQFEMRAIEAIGLVKMDLLGNRALSTIDECVTLARAARPEQAARLDPERLPDPDPETCARLAAGDTLNCFQLESPAMRHLLRMLGARSLDQVIAAVALVRPGPAESGMKAAFCRRARGLEPASFLHPRLRPVLEATHGVLLYEEDVLRVAAALAGLSLAEGDDLRRAIGAARQDDARRSLERGFVAQARRAGIDEPAARAVWAELARFGSYAFCKAHAAGYGVLGYASAYLKAHAPVEWAVAVLNHHAGMYATWVHVEDLRRQGVRFEPPCVRRSAWDTTLEPAAHRDADGGANGVACGNADGGETAHASGAGGTPATSPVERPHHAGRVRVGLGRVFGLHESTGERIVAARAGGAFRSLADVVDRVRPTLPELESLIDAGALDALGRTRPSLRLEARVTAGARRGPASALGVRAGATVTRAPALVGAGGGAFLPAPSAPVATPELPEFGPAERVRRECAATGLWFTAHPLDVMIPPDAERGAVPAATLEAHAGRAVSIVGMPCASRRVETKQGQPMLFLTVADRSGLAECVLFPDAYRAFAEATRGAIVRVEGRVDVALDAVTLGVSHCAALARAAIKS